MSRGGSSYFADIKEGAFFMNPRDVLNKRFEKGFGYKQEEVDSYLREVSAALAAALKDRDEQEAKIIKLVDKINEYRSDESAIGNALLVAQKQASRIIAEAKEEASKLVSEAQARRDAMIAEITSDCETIKRSQIEKIAVAVSQESAKLEAVKALAEDKIKEQTQKLLKLKAEVSDFKGRLLGLYEEQIKLAAQLPDITDEELNALVSPEVTVPETASVPPEEASAPEEAPNQEASRHEDIPFEQPKARSERKDAENMPFGFTESGAKHIDNPFGELKFGQNRNRSKNHR